MEKENEKGILDYADFDNDSCFGGMYNSNNLYVGIDCCDDVQLNNYDSSNDFSNRTSRHKAATPFASGSAANIRIRDSRDRASMFS